MVRYDFEVPIPASPGDREARTQALLESLEQRILVLDGATGTGLQNEDLTADDFGGPDLEGCNENLCRTRPDVVRRLHALYLAAGADIVETNSFGGTPLVLAEYGLQDAAFELNRLAARSVNVSMSQGARVLSVAPWVRPPKPSR
jgi:5-methyltetrahydrofolate--homocysteine methyltransferase